MRVPRLAILVLLAGCRGGAPSASTEPAPGAAGSGASVTTDPGAGASPTPEPGAGSSVTSDPPTTTPPPPKPLPTKPLPPPPPTVGPKLGEACGAGDACGDGACVSYRGIAGARGPEFKTCEIRCGGKGACPAGRSCITIADGPGQVCR